MNDEKIISIKEIENKEVEGSYGYFDGYSIQTDGKEIFVGIRNGHACCENWGYVSSEDNFNEYIGASIINVTLADASLVKKEIPNTYEGDAMFVNVETSNGTLQFVMYNAHNGYYSHESVVVSRQLNHSTNL